MEGSKTRKLTIRKVPEANPPSEARHFITFSGTDAIDKQSRLGNFGWARINDQRIPIVYRFGRSYCAPKMLKMQVLNFLQQEILDCINIKGYYLTEAETRLLNQISVQHPNRRFGNVQLTEVDCIIRLSDAVELANFLWCCYGTLISRLRSAPRRCGFVRTGRRYMIPYVLYHNTKCIPLFHCSAENREAALQKAHTIEGWYVAYLKFCYATQSIKPDFIEERCLVVSINDLTDYSEEAYQDYWPQVKTLWYILRYQRQSQQPSRGIEQPGPTWEMRRPLPPTSRHHPYHLPSGSSVATNREDPQAERNSEATSSGSTK